MIGPSGRRAGFDVVAITCGDNDEGDGLPKRAPLARLATADQRSPLRVCKYTVDVQSFDSLALPCMETPKRVLVLDEVGGFHWEVI